MHGDRRAPARRVDSRHELLTPAFTGTSRRPRRRPARGRGRRERRFAEIEQTEQCIAPKYRSRIAHVAMTVVLAIHVFRRISPASSPPASARPDLRSVRTTLSAPVAARRRTGACLERQSCSETRPPPPGMRGLAGDLSGRAGKTARPPSRAPNRVPTARNETERRGIWWMSKLEPSTLNCLFFRPNKRFAPSLVEGSIPGASTKLLLLLGFTGSWNRE
jgi:hypothetical protein